MKADPEMVTFHKEWLKADTDADYQWPTHMNTIQNNSCKMGVKAEVWNKVRWSKVIIS